jgi:integrase
MTVRPEKKNGRDGWVADLRHGGRGKRKWFELKRDAQAYLDKHGRRESKRQRVPTDRPTIDAFIARIMEQRRGSIAAASYDIMRTQLGHFSRYEVRPGVRLGALRLETLDGDGATVLRVLNQQAAAGYAVDSVRLCRDKMRELFDRAMSQGYILQHPLHDPDTRRDIKGLFKKLRMAHPKRVKAMKLEQMHAFLKAAEQVSAAFPLFVVGFGTGARIEELIALRDEDDVVRPVDGKLTRQLHICRAIPQRMSRRNPEPKQLKNEADYYVDVGTELGEFLDERKRPGWDFQTRNGTPVSHEWVQGEFKRVVRLAGLDRPDCNFTPHSMRHTFATLNILAGKPVKWVSEQLGHSDVMVTLRTYASAFQMVCPGAADDHGARVFAYRKPADGTRMAPAASVAVMEPAPTLH